MPKRLTQFKIQVVLASILWFAVVGWFAIVQIPPSALYNKESPEVQSRMEVECTGSYQQRYDCKNMIAIEVSNNTLMQVSVRIALTVTGPCIGLWLYSQLKRREPKRKPPPVVHDDMSWKSAAKSNVAPRRMNQQDDEQDDESYR